MRNQIRTQNWAISHKSFKKMKTPVVFSVFILSIFLSCSGQYTKWEHNVSVKGLEFKKVRFSIKSGDTTMTIGYLKSSAVVGETPVSADWLHLDSENNPVLYQLEKETELSNFLFPAGAWIVKIPEGIAAVFPVDTTIGGYLCRGGGGANGIRTAFHSSGSIKYFYSRGVTDVGGIKCKGGTMHTISLHKDGTLSGCTLAEDHTFNGILFKKGEKVRFDESGKVATANR
jgi:hypothetical protein